MGFSRQEYWSGLPFPPPGDLPNSHLLQLPHWQTVFTTSPPGKPKTRSHPKVTLRTVGWRCSSVARTLHFKGVSPNQPPLFFFFLLLLFLLLKWVLSWSFTVPFFFFNSNHFLVSQVNRNKKLSYLSDDVNIFFLIHSLFPPSCFVLCICSNIHVWYWRFFSNAWWSPTATPQFSAEDSEGDRKPCGSPMCRMASVTVLWSGAITRGHLDFLLYCGV